LQVLAGPYRTPHLAFEGIAVYTNKGPTGSFRAPAGPMANFAVESQIDMIADDLGIDPLDMRLSNAFREGDTGPAGEPLTSVSIAECLTRAADAIGWNDRRPGSGRGKGIACSWWMTTGGSSGVYVKINPEGTVTLVSGAVEIGTGALTGAAQVLAEELGIDLPTSTCDVTPFLPTASGAGSRTAFGRQRRIAAAGPAAADSSRGGALERAGRQPAAQGKGINNGTRNITGRGCVLSQRWGRPNLARHGHPADAGLRS
jgi:CO/xanthine dehydrogenase Mo-binding subunit